jgi:hypothetical protein
MNLHPFHFLINQQQVQIVDNQYIVPSESHATELSIKKNKKSKKRKHASNFKDTNSKRRKTSNDAEEEVNSPDKLGE